MVLYSGSREFKSSDDQIIFFVIFFISETCWIMKFQNFGAHKDWAKFNLKLQKEPKISLVGLTDFV
jgi:hypothetical protein